MPTTKLTSLQIDIQTYYKTFTLPVLCSYMDHLEMGMHTQTHIHTQTHTYTHTYTQTHKHTHTHKHTYTQTHT